MVSALVCAILTFQPAKLHLIPTPRLLKHETGEFPLGRHADLVLDEPSDQEDSFAAEQLLNESPESFGWVSKKRSPLRVYVGQIGRDKSLAKHLRKLGLHLSDTSTDESYALIVRPKEVFCVGKGAAGTFYAVQTLKQLIRANKRNNGIPCVSILDAPALKMRGWQDDISRGPIPTLDFLKKEVRELSEYKLNAFTLYTEHVFRLKKHPTIAPTDGISAEEVKELDKYCKKYHVQLIGNFQSFGHFANILKVPGYENLKETSDVITPAKEESYQFLKEVYDEIAPAYSSNLFNINCDETYGLGEGPAKEMVAKEGLGNVYAKHINRVSTLLKSHGKTPMMWGDIALQYPDIRKNLPKSLVVLTWGYDPRASFVDQIEPFTKMGFQFLVCPGVSCWGQNFPDLKTATTNISNFVRDGAKLGALGMLNTTWDDTGENLFNNNWYPLVWGAEVSWNPVATVQTVQGTTSKTIPELLSDKAKSTSSQIEAFENQQRMIRIATFDQAFPRLFFGLPDGSLSNAMWQLSDLRFEPVVAGHSDQAFWRAPSQIPGLGANEKAVLDRVRTIGSTFKNARSQATRNADALNAPFFAVAKVAHLISVSQMMSSVPLWMKEPAADRIKFAQNGSKMLAGSMSTLKNLYQNAWEMESRRWWLQRNLAKFDQAKVSLATIGTTPVFDPPGGAANGRLNIHVDALVPGEFHFTTDGSEPNSQSPLITDQISIEKSTRLRVTNIVSGQASPVTEATYILLSRPAKLQTDWTHYGDNTMEKAFDGLLDTYFWSYGSVAKGSLFTVLFDDPDMIGGVKVTTGHPDHPEDYLHEGVLEVTNDGQKWKEVAKFEKGVAETGMIGFRVKGIRIRVTKDNGNWLVIREIALK